MDVLCAKVLELYFRSAASAKVTVASSGQGRSTASASGTSIPNAIPIRDDGDQANQGGAPTGNVDPNLGSEQLVSEEDFTELKTMFRRIYGFTIVSCSDASCPSGIG